MRSSCSRRRCSHSAFRQLASASPAPSVSATAAGLAIGGYDPVAYFTRGPPGRRLRRLRACAGTAPPGASPRPQSRDRFEANPDSLCPALWRLLRLGGQPEFYISRPATRSVWRIVDGRLYLNFNQRAKVLWEADLATPSPAATRIGRLCSRPRKIGDSIGYELQLDAHAGSSHSDLGVPSERRSIEAAAIVVSVEDLSTSTHSGRSRRRQSLQASPKCRPAAFGQFRT